VQSEPFDAGEVTSFWLIEADEALSVAHHLMEKSDYSYALFFGHLAVEKLLKALYAHRLGQHAPPIHSLLRLCRAVGLELSKAHEDALITITAFNMEARYPDMKRTFRQKCTALYSEQQLAAVREVFEWLKSEMM
jgi:HEPN domain-containing protein